MNDDAARSGDLLVTEDRARGRFFMISAMRLAGVALSCFGIFVIAKRVIEPASVIGGALVLAGLIEATVVPVILARKWRTIDDQ